MKMKSGVVIGIIVVVVILILLVVGIILLSERGRNSSPNYTQAMKDQMNEVSEGLNTKAKGKVTNGELTLFYEDAPTEGYYATYDNRDNSMFIGHFTGTGTTEGYSIFIGTPTEKIVGEKVSDVTGYGDLADLSAVSNGTNKFKTSVLNQRQPSIFTDYSGEFELKSSENNS
jgi:hypothetical protein